MDDNHQVFQAKAQIVVVDVVVTGKNGAPLTGLQRQDFQASEDGHPQALTHFEEHTGSEPIKAPLPVLPPNVFSNIPRAKLGDSVTVLLLDSLNTPIADQSRVRLEVLKFLKGLQPGQRMAIFGLSTQLRFIQGFSDDPVALAAAIDRKGTGQHIQGSPLLDSNSETAQTQDIVATMRALPGGEGDSAANAVEQFMADQRSARSDLRLKMTLSAFQALAQYLAAIPGRKNLAWFSGAFPVVLLPDLGISDPSGPQRDDQEDVRKTDALLASAQVAVYPISSEGVATGSFFSSETDTRQSQQQIATAREADMQDRFSAHSAMDDIARYTGGKAFYNTNGLKDALASVVNNGSHYYTLTYSSANQATDGRYRKIQVKLSNLSGYQLAYRQGYYADGGKNRNGAAVAKANAPEPLSPLMRAGLPDTTQIPLNVAVRRGNDEAATLAQSGSNPVLVGRPTPYTVHFFIPPGGLQLEQSANGQHQLSIDAALLIYDRDGKLLNRTLRQIDMNLDAAHYETAAANGINFSLKIDAPDKGAYLRSGVYDLKSNLAGTLQVPLSALVEPLPLSSR